MAVRKTSASKMIKSKNAKIQKAGGRGTAKNVGGAAGRTRTSTSSSGRSSRRGDDGGFLFRYISGELVRILNTKVPEPKTKKDRR